ncbi:MAG: phage tail sheath family protein [Anaerolineales bacterium]|nr:phage tail sheath family protein [Anaerolineales bacterium]MCB8961472.1 phage tail sheath family protein [Ardenticatenales bacterium]MCB0007185.1 phage tail sheath family protein [Anaerolineales bacterium]MCB0010836.1 phage tail sheath family protein [Anaerolineales bacterium]MCB0017568.1 phage tail sheath family protein [Anaerolineales bacterium]
MATSYQTKAPGVYVEELQSAVKPIAAVGTSITAFVGITAEASRKALNPETGAREPVESRLNKATLVTSWTQYVDTFGGFLADAYLPDAVYGFYNNGGGPCYVVSLRAVAEDASNAKSASVDVTAGGKKAFTVTATTAGESGNNLSVTVKNDVDKDGKPTGTFSLTIGGETKAGLAMKKGDGHVGDAEFAAASISGVTGTAAPDDGTYNLSGGGMPPLDVADFVGDALERTGLAGLEALDDVSLLACPDIFSGYDGSDKAKERVKSIQTAMITHCELMGYRFALLDTPPGMNAQQAKEWRNYCNYDTSYAAMYYPWITVPDLTGSDSTSRNIPPSGYVVGVYNRTDSERGVHKAPANEIVRGAIDLELNLSRGEQDTLNPIGVNCIRAFTGRGIRIWGARTLSSDTSWRYINVRRLFIMIEASMDQGLQWVVFEPNDYDLWQRVRRDVTTFLRMVWRSGALFGRTEDEAFYVKVDEELNPSEVRDLGMLIIEAGVCPVKPAEFVIFRISQWAGPNAG